MTIWLMRTSAARSVIDGLLLFQITGSAIPVLIAPGAPILRRVAPSFGAR